MPLRIASVTIDCHDVSTMVRFWSAALGYTPVDRGGGDSGSVEDPHDRDVELLFLRVPEGKSIKNRVHLDLGADNREVEVQRLVDLGATVIQVFPTWTVMGDPEGNEFCVCDVSPDDPIELWRT